jgi:hypothetical protein
MKAYRTLIGVLVLGAFALVGLVFVALADEARAGALATAYGSLAMALVGLGAALSGKSAAEKFARGGRVEDQHAQD